MIQRRSVWPLGTLEMLVWRVKAYVERKVLSFFHPSTDIFASKLVILPNFPIQSLWLHKNIRLRGFAKIVRGPYVKILINIFNNLSLRKGDPVLILLFLFFKKIGQSRPLFVYFRPFLSPISITIYISTLQIEKSMHGVVRFWTGGRKMVGADKTTELWRPPQF